MLIRFRLLALLLASCSILATGCSSMGRIIYVSAEGNDDWSGRRDKPTGDDGPFATIERARDEIRAWKQTSGLPRGDVTVAIMPGRYELHATITFGPEDSGAADRPIVYRAAGGEVRFTGGPIVGGFEPVAGAPDLDRLDPVARGKVVRADLRAQGISDYGSPGGGGLEVFFADEPMQISRWPNTGFTRIAKEAGGDKVDIRGRGGDRIGKWVYEGDRPARWADEVEVWVHGYWFWDWSEQRHRVRSIDVDSKLMEVEEPYHGYGYRKGQWYYAYNLLSEIDEPGEWHLDRETGELTFWPPAPMDSADLVVSKIDTALAINGASHLTFRAITFEAFRGDVIRVNEGESNRVIGCTIRNSAGNAIVLAGGSDHGAVGCDIYGMGNGGVIVRGGDRATLTPAGNFAENNHIHHYARWNRVYQTAVSLAGVGNRASHNLIHDAPHMAIGFSGNEHLIEFNEIHDVCFESNDAGAIYSGRDWTMRGTVIRNNYLHHINGFEAKGCVGVYLDDMFSGTEITGNLFYRVTRAAFIGGGRDCLVANNIFVDCRNALHIDNRAQGWAADTVESTMKPRLEAMPYRSALWSERYPELLTLWDDEPAAPKGNRIERNIFFEGNWNDVTSGAKPYQTIENNVTDEDPRFAHFSHTQPPRAPRPADFALAPDSPAHQIGFVAPPLEKIGLYESDDRASWPALHPVRADPLPN